MQKRFTDDKPNRLHLVDNDVLLTNRWIYNRQLDANKDLLAMHLEERIYPLLTQFIPEQRSVYSIISHLIFCTTLTGQRFNKPSK